MSISNTPDNSAAPPPASGVPASPPDTAFFHWTLFGLSAVVLALSLTLSVRGEEEVLIPFLEIPVPGACTFKRLMGIGCPGCGLTRCFVSLGHGDLRRAWRFNPVGFFLFGALLFQLPYRVAQIWRLRRGLPEVRLGVLGAWFSMATAILLVLQWALRNSGWLP